MKFHILQNIEQMHELPEKCDNPKFNGKNLTNRLLIQNTFGSDSQKNITYYCPAYLRLEVQNFSEMNFEDMEASINCVLVLTVNFRGLNPALEAKVRPLLKLGFNRDDSLQIKESSKSKAISMNVKEGGVYVYTIYKIIHVAMNPNVQFFPLNIVHLIMSVYIKDIQVNSYMLKQAIKQSELMMKRKWVQVDKMLNEKDNLKLELKKILEEKEIKKIHESIQEIDKKLKKIYYVIKALKSQESELHLVSNINIRFNFMDTDIGSLKILAPPDENFGFYRLAKAKMNVQYINTSASRRVRPKTTKNSKKSLQIDQKVDYSKIYPFNYAHFDVPIFKVPDVALFTIFFPLWLLAVLLLGIYFQDTNLADRIMNLSAIMIAFVALIPVIRQQLPQSPNIALVEVLVYAQILTGILCFGESIQVRDAQNYIFTWYENTFFLISFVITCLEISVLLIMWLIHKLNRVPRFMNAPIQTGKIDFKYQKWYNLQCDRHFQRKVDNFRIKVVHVDKAVENFKRSENRLQEEDIPQIQKYYEQRISIVQEIKASPEYKSA